MGRPPKPMTPAERSALDEFLLGTADELKERRARGVLRLLAPEFEHACRPRRGRPTDPTIPVRVRALFEMFTDRRMRHENMRRPFTPKEAIARIAVNLNLKRRDVNRIIHEEEYWREYQEKVAAEDQAAVARIERLNACIIADYTTAFRSKIRDWNRDWKNGKTGRPGAHEDAIKTVVAKYKRSSAEVEKLVAQSHDALLRELVDEAKHLPTDR